MVSVITQRGGWGGREVGGRFKREGTRILPVAESC